MTSPIEFYRIEVLAVPGRFPSCFDSRDGTRITWTPGEPWVRVVLTEGGGEYLYPVAAVRGAPKPPGLESVAFGPTQAQVEDAIRGALAVKPVDMSNLEAKYTAATADFDRQVAEALFGPAADRPGEPEPLKGGPKPPGVRAKTRGRPKRQPTG